MTTMIDDIVRPLALTLNLLSRFWPQLLAIGAAGYIARDLLLNAAVTVGLQHPLGGMVVLSLVVLVKLLVVVMMFAALRPGLPALAGLRQEPADTPAGPGWRRGSDQMLAITAAVILPFFAYYAAWGFLGDTVREYSRLALDRLAFGEKIDIFDLLQSRGLIASIAACWAVRWFAKRMNKRSQAPGWRLLVVAADASWIFIGLYALSLWKKDFISWIGGGSFLDGIEAGALSIAAHAAEGFTPAEFRSPAALTQLRDLFFYALLPMIWLVMAAIINGYDLSPKAAVGPAPAASPASTWRKWLSDFVTHFLGGYRKRYRPVWICLRLTLGAGLASLVTFIIVFRLLNWLGAWLWYAMTHTIGPYDLPTWQAIASVASMFIGSPSDLNGGIVLDSARIALLAAVLEYAVVSQTRGNGRRQAAAT